MERSGGKGEVERASRRRRGGWVLEEKEEEKFLQLGFSDCVFRGMGLEKRGWEWRVRGWGGSKGGDRKCTPLWRSKSGDVY